MKKLGIIMAAGFAALVAAYGQIEANAWREADAESPFLIRYNDADKVGTITIAANAITLTDDGEATVIALDANTLSATIASMNAAQNASGVCNFEVIYWAGLSTDTLANNLVTCSATAVTKEWSTVAKWDTSAVVHYNVVTSSKPSGRYTKGGAAHKIVKLCGEPSGTGDVTVSVYVDGSREFYTFIESPQYVTPSAVNGAGSTSYTEVNAVDIGKVNLGSGIRVGDNQVGFVRVVRATTATTGGIGAGVIRP